MRLLSSLCVRQAYLSHRHGPQAQSGLAIWSKQFANLPERYLLRKTRRLIYAPPVASPEFSNAVELTRIPDFNMQRPWWDDFWMTNSRFPDQKTPNVYAEPIREKDWMWFRGDRVEVTRGKDKGKQGYINFIVQERNWVCVEGLNCKYQTMGKDRDFPGMMYMEEQPLTVTTDIKLVDPADEQPTDVEWRFTEDGERIRVSVRTGRHLPIPSESFETVDYKTPAGYAENKHKDTKASVVEEITFEPKLATFEMDIMERRGIKEDRVPKETFWY